MKIYVDSHLRILLLLIVCAIYCVPHGIADELRLPLSLTVIEDETFINDKNITNVIIPDGAISIGARAFAGCANLTRIEIPDTVTMIGEDAFDECSYLTICCSDGSIAQEYAMKNGIRYNELLNTTIPEGLDYGIEETYAYIVAYTGSATELVLPDEIDGFPVTMISQSAFRGCSTLKSVRLPNHLNMIGYHAFYDCENLENVFFPNSLTEIWPYAFGNCGKLDNVLLPASVKTLGYGAFVGCKSLSTVQYPIGWSSCGYGNQGTDGPFAGCVKLTNIVIPEGVTCVPSYAFRGSNLETISLPESLTAIYPYAFDGSSLQAIRIPEGVSVIPASAFQGCRNLQSVILHENITAIYSYAFAGCVGLEEIILPEGLTKIFDGAFANCTALKKIVLPNSITDLGGSVFSACSSLKSINYPLSWNNASGANSPFAGLDCFTSFVIPEGIKAIPTRAFMECASLERIEFPDTLQTIGAKAFYGCEKLERIALPNGLKTINSEAFYGCERIEKAEINEGVTFVGARAFDKCTGLKYVSWPSTADSMNQAVFARCESLCDVQIAEGLISIYGQAFWECRSLTSIHLPDSVTTIQSGAFMDCSNLKLVNYPVSLKYYGDRNSPFYACANLTTMTVPEGVTSIPAFAFYNTSIETIILPSTIRTIGMDAFGADDASTVKLKNVYFSGKGEFESYDNTFWNIGSELTVYGASGSYAETFAANKGFSFVAVDEEPFVVLPQIYAPAENAAYSTTEISAVWQYQSAAEDYLVSVYEIAEDGTETASFEQNTTECNIVLSLERGKHYRLEVTARNSYGEESMSRRFSIKDAATLAQVKGFTMSSDTITVGTAAFFQVETVNASFIRLVVDGQEYNEYPVVSDVTQIGRKFTLAGDRQVAFRVYGDGVWSEPCEAQTLHVTADGQLVAPTASCERKIWLEDSLTVNWEPVEHANGYVLYLNYPDGTSQGRGIELNAQTLTYTYPAEEITAVGEYSVRVMAYGEGYSQSSVLVPFTVTDEYVSWKGWPQASKVRTYETADSTTDNGYVDYLDPVTVLGEEGDCYYIEMVLTSGGTARRYVRKNMIGTEQFVPGLTLNASYAIDVDGNVYVYAKTNLVSCKAGVEQKGSNLQTLYKPTSLQLYTKIYAFSVEQTAGTKKYTVFAEDGDGNRLEKDLTVVIADKTPEPEITAVPETTPEPEATPTPEGTIIPQVTVTPVILITPEPAPSVTPSVSCKFEVNGVHKLEYVQLKNMFLTLYNDGRIRVDSAACGDCGARVNTFGFVPDNVQTQFYFHPIARYYDTSGNNKIYSYNNDYAAISVNEDLTISNDIDLNGASLVVNGILRVESTLSNVSKITCKELIVEGSGKVQADAVTRINVIGGKFEIKSGGSVVVNPKSHLSVDGKMIVDGELHGGDRLECGSLSVGSKGYLGLAEGFDTCVNEDFTFKSNQSHQACFGKNSSLKIGGDIRISGNQFAFNGTCTLLGKAQLVKMEENDGNYFEYLDMTEGGSVLTLNNKKTELVYDNWNPSNKFKAKSVSHSLISSPAEMAVNEFFNQILKEPLKDGSGVTYVLNASMFIRPLLTQSLQVDEEKYRKLIFGDVYEKDVSAEDVITGVIGLVSTDSKDDQERIKHAIRYGLMREMFIKRGTHNFGFKAFELNFSSIYGDSESFKTEDGKTWSLEIDGGIDMDIVLTDKDEANSSVVYLAGTIKDGDGKKHTFSYSTNNRDLYRASLALRAAGMAEIVKELESAVEEAVGAATEGLKEIELFKEFDRQDKLRDFVYEHSSFKIQNAMDIVKMIGEETADERKLFKEFKKFYDLSLKFYPPQP